MGVAGTGKQTVARFAAYVSEVVFRTVEHRRGYSILDFREDLKSAYNVSWDRLCLPSASSCDMHAWMPSVVKGWV